jgi:DNA end-binding protein Ku
MSVLTNPSTLPSAARNGCTLPASAPPGRPSWSGILRISLVAIPIKAYPTISSSSRGPQAHLLHADCGQRIAYHKHCRHHGPVPSEAIVKGYEYAPDRYVIVEPQELDHLRPARDKALLLEQCLPVAQVDPTLFAGRSLYLLPDGAAAQHPYAVLAEALREAGQGALGRVVLSSQRQLVLVRPAGRVLVLDVLHYPAQVRSATSWEAAVPACAPTEAERALAKQLIALSSGAVDWGHYRDTNAEELVALVQAKIAQQPPTAPAEEPVVLSLLDALKQSVAQVEHAEMSSETTTAKARRPRSRRRTG